MVKMTYKELVDKISEKINMPKTHVKTCLDAAGEEILAVLEMKGKVPLANLGTFTYKAFSSRVCINPKTREKLTVPARGGCGFKSSTSTEATLKTVK